MAVNEQSVATDLGALLRESLNDEQELAGKNNASIPVQLATAPAGFAPPGASLVPTPQPPSMHPASGIQLTGTPAPTGSVSVVPAIPHLSQLATPFEIPLSRRPSVPVAQKAGSRAGVIVGLFVGAIVLAGAGGGGFAWYRAKHAAAATKAPATQVAPVATAPAAPATAESTPATPATAESAPAAPATGVAATDTTPAPPTTGAAAEPAAPAEKNAAAAPVAAPARPRRAAAPAAAAKDDDEEDDTPAAPPAPAPKPAAAKPAAPPATTAAAAPAKPAGGVDALLQQQLSGAIP